MTHISDSSRRHFLKTAGTAVLATGALGALQPHAAAQENDGGGKKVGWAIMGLGHLALGEVMPAFAHCKRSAPVALVSGHPDKAKDVAQKFGVDPKNIYNYENYDSIKDNPAIDVVYNI